MSGDAARVWATLALDGRWDAPCLVVCRACRLVTAAPDLWAGQALAEAHDRAMHGRGARWRDGGDD